MVHMPVTVHDGVEPMGDGQDGAVRELLADRLLDQLVSFQIHRSRGLVQHQNLNAAFVFVCLCVCACVYVCGGGEWVGGGW